MPIDSVRIRGQQEPDRQEVVLEIATVDPSQPDRLELSIIRGDVLEDCAVVEVGDLLTAIRALRAMN